MKISDLLEASSESAITFSKRISPDLVAELRADPEVGEFATDISRYQAILINSQEVGSIRMDGDGKIGSLFIREKFRGKGFATAAIEASKGTWTFIDSKNTSSQRSFEKAGFSNTGKQRFGLDVWEKKPPLEPDHDTTKWEHK